MGYNVRTARPGPAGPVRLLQHPNFRVPELPNISEGADARFPR